MIDHCTQMKADEYLISQIYQNIKRFSELKIQKNSKFPRTKIQMVLTDDTYNEVDNFYKLFDGIVDDISLKQYTERGGTFGDVGKEIQEKILQKDRVWWERFWDLHPLGSTFNSTCVWWCYQCRFAN